MKILKDPFLWLAAILICMMAISKCSETNKDLNAADQLINYEDSAKFYKNKQGELIAYNLAVQLDLKTGKKLIDSLQGYLKDMKIKNPGVIIRTNTVIRIDTILVELKDTLPCPPFTRWEKVKEKWYKMDLRLTNKNATIVNMMIPNEQELVTGYKKNGILRRDSFVVAIKNTNPYMHVQTIGALSFKPDVKWHDKLWFKTGVAAVAFLLGRGSK